MKSSLRGALAALFAASALASAAGPVALAQDNTDRSTAHWMERWSADHAALLDAKLAGLKAGLKLTPDQEKLWPPFEAAVRAAAQMRMEHMHDMMERMDEMRSMGEMGMRGEMGMHGDMNMEEGHMTSPIDRLDMMACRLTQAGEALKKVADAGKPLYASLEDSQKRIFGFLAPEMLMMGGPGRMGAHGHHHWGHEDEGGPDEQ